MTHRAKKTGQGNYEYRGFDIQRNNWSGTSWSFKKNWSPTHQQGGTCPSLKVCKQEIDEILDGVEAVA